MNAANLTSYADIKSLNLYRVLGKGGSLGSGDWARKMLSLNFSLELLLNLSKNLSLLQGPSGPVESQSLFKLHISTASHFGTAIYILPFKEAVAVF